MLGLFIFLICVDFWNSCVFHCHWAGLGAALPQVEGCGSELMVKHLTLEQGTVIADTRARNCCWIAGGWNMKEDFYVTKSLSRRDRVVYYVQTWKVLHQEWYCWYASDTNLFFVNKEPSHFDGFGFYLIILLIIFIIIFYLIISIRYKELSPWFILPFVDKSVHFFIHELQYLNSHENRRRLKIQ